MHPRPPFTARGARAAYRALSSFGLGAGVLCATVALASVWACSDASGERPNAAAERREALGARAGAQVEGANRAGVDAPTADDLSAALARRLDTIGDASLDSLYGSSPEPLWVDANGLTTQGREALDTLAYAEREGLPLTRYGVDSLRALAGEDRADRSGAAAGPLVRLETGLSQGLALLAHDLALGVVASTSWDPGLHMDSVDSPELPADADGGGTVLDRLDALRPSVGQYARLQDVRSTILEIERSGDWPEVHPRRLLQPGDSAPAVAHLRSRLAESVSPEERRLAGRGADRPDVFDDALGEALSLFQGRHDIVQDGSLGPETAEALNVPVDERVAQVELAMERWRWLPADLGTVPVLVNTPGRRVHVLDDGNAALSMKAIVGERDWRTALFQDHMEEIVVNPYWNIPESIMRQETLPRAVADSTYCPGCHGCGGDTRPCHGLLPLSHPPAAGRQQRSGPREVHVPEPLRHLPPRHAGGSPVRRAAAHVQPRVRPGGAPDGARPPASGASLEHSPIPLRLPPSNGGAARAGARRSGSHLPRLPDRLGGRGWCADVHARCVRARRGGPGGALRSTARSPG
jgi:murein L,D-transpeptidase YcbB/YkuD